MILARRAAATRTNDHKIPAVAKHAADLLIRRPLERIPLSRGDIALICRDVEPQQSLRRGRDCNGQQRTHDTAPNRKLPR